MTKDTHRGPLAGALLAYLDDLLRSGTSMLEISGGEKWGQEENWSHTRPGPRDSDSLAGKGHHSATVLFSSSSRGGHQSALNKMSPFFSPTSTVRSSIDDDTFNPFFSHLLTG